METLNQLKVQAFRNALRLFRDACLLAEHSRNETAFAIAVLAYEEIGKSALADRQLDTACLNPGSEGFARQTMKALLKEHGVKQAWAGIETGGSVPSHLKALDLKKQQALYVDYDGKKVTTPQVSDEELRELLREVYRALKDLEDLPYYGVAGNSSDKSQWQAKQDIKAIEHDFHRVTGL